MGSIEITTEYAEVSTVEELRELYGYPGQRARAKERSTLHEMDRRWLAASPFCLMATSDEDGNLDVSPKGDPPGFLVHVIDDRTIAIPDRPGNRRIDGWLNIIANPRVGLNFVVPGRNETLRINGRARIVRDAPFFDALVVKGHRPMLALVVDIDTIFFHCGKAFLRSQMWRPETWTPDALPSHACITQAVQRTDMTIEQLEEYYGPAYAERIYVESVRIDE